VWVPALVWTAAENLASTGINLRDEGSKGARNVTLYNTVTLEQETNTHDFVRNVIITRLL
jgi:hypothetical protein